MKLLIVEDDRETAETLRHGLLAESHAVDVAENGADGAFMGKSFDYDAIILDYSLPKKDGIQVCKEIRSAKKNTPIIFVSVTADCGTKVSALENGADDYMTKPFSLQELYARLKAVTRRPANMTDPILCVGDLSLDTEKHLVWRGDTPIHPTRKEFNLLEYFMRHKSTVLSRTLIMEHVWTADSDPFSNTVEAHIRNLRKKINIGEKPDMIANVPGRGYIIDAPENLEKL